MIVDKPRMICNVIIKYSLSAFVRTFKTALFAVAIMALFAGSSHAATYYVSPTGSALWSACTATITPCSWQTAMANAVADDVVYFRGGTYTVETGCSGTWEYIAMAPAHSGSAGHPITFIAYPGETPIVNGCVSIESPAFGARDVDYIIWDGFTSGTILDADRENWYFLYWNSNYSIVRNCTFSGIDSILGDGHRNSAPIRVEKAHDVEIYNNDLRCSGGVALQVNSACVYLFSAVNTKIFNNTMRDGSFGVQQKINDNLGNEIYNNLFHSMDESGVELYESSAPGGGHKIYHNVFVNIGDAAVDSFASTGLSQNWQIYNNTIYNARRGIVMPGNFRTAQIWNNIISHRDSAPFIRTYTGVAIPAYINYNTYYPVGPGGYWNTDYAVNYYTITDWRTALGGGCPVDGNDCNSITTDPGYVNPGGTTAADYKRTSYPTNGRGGSYASVMGAYINGSELIGYQAGGSFYTYTIGGTVTGLTGTLVLQNNGGDDRTITANGTYTFLSSMGTGSAYSVTVLTQPAGMTCAVNNASGTVASANITNANLACTLLPQCADGIDNDGDSLIDMNDPGCSSAADNDEVDAPQPPQTCTSFTYSAWGACQPGNTQARTVLSSSPNGCTGGGPITTQTCTYIPPSGQNSPPSAPSLVSPANGASGLGATVEFRWNASTDPDGDVLTYQLHNCTDQSFSDCTPVAVAKNSKALFYAGGAGLFMIGMTFISGLTKRGRIVPLLMIAVLLAGGVLLSCGTGGDSTLTPAPNPLPADEMSHTVTTLTPGTTYYWKVVADDGKGGIAESEAWSYSTQ